MLRRHLSLPAFHRSPAARANSVTGSGRRVWTLVRPGPSARFRGSRVVNSRIPDKLPAHNENFYVYFYFSSATVTENPPLPLCVVHPFKSLTHLAPTARRRPYEVSVVRLRGNRSGAPGPEQ